MKVKFWCIGKTESEYLRTGISEYNERLNHYLSYEYKEFNISKKSAKIADQQKAESNEIIKSLKPTDELILLDEKGKEMSSEGFANFLQKRFNEGGSDLIFLIGGAYGFSKELSDRAQHTISLSRMTFTHQMVRLIFTEQLYRAMTILKGEKYHH